MLFNSTVFVAFFCVIYTLYLVLGTRWQNRWLLLGSYVFYGWWDVRFLILIFISTVIDYAAGLGMDGVKLSARRRIGLGIATGLASALFVVPDWPAIQNSADPSIKDAFTDTWPGSMASIAVCLAFAIIGPVLYGLYFRIRDEGTRRRAFVITSIIANLTILGFFKYANFFIESAERALGSLGMEASYVTLNIVLPVGISFYTFQTMSYTIDIFRKELRATDRFLDFALYVAFFPQLVAGPIERAKTLLPQVLAPRRLTAEGLREGAFLVGWGFYKKIFIADNCAIIVNRVFNDSDSYNGTEYLIAVYAFAFQIYCDFSGYTDIARGLAKLMGFEFRLNFNLPYFATNPSEFWRRWHISLSSWLRDYLYIPLGGSRAGVFGTYKNLVITMLLGGLWHGAKWTMILWGAYQGAILVAHRLIIGGGTSAAKAREQGVGPFKKALLILFFFQVTCMGWLIFRANSVPQIGEMVVGMASDLAWTEFATRSTAQLALLLTPLIIFQIIQYRTRDLLIALTWRPLTQLGAVLLLSAVCFVYWILFRTGIQGGNDFIYFQF